MTSSERLIQRTVVDVTIRDALTQIHLWTECTLISKLAGWLQISARSNQPIKYRHADIGTSDVGLKPSINRSLVLIAQYIKITIQNVVN